MYSRGPRSSRAERMTTSCSECRRRKQKCNQDQPCSNCARRFPQPVCEYRAAGQRRAVTPVTLQQSISTAPSNRPKPDMSEPTISIPGTSQPLLPLNTPVLPRIFSSRRIHEATDGGGDGLACDENCTLHSEAVHNGAKLLRVLHSIPDIFAGESFRGLSPSAFDTAPKSAGTWPDGADLLQIYIQLFAQFNASLDGFPDSSNLYTKLYIPYCTQTPLLVQGAIHTAACLLSETGHIDNTVAISHKGRAIAILNDHLRSQPSTTDESIAGVVQLITDEFYWGDTDDLHAHLRGLQEMIRSRGGFRNIGLHGLISKLAISSDAAIALASEAAPFLRDGPEFEFRESSVPLRLSLNTPFVSHLVPFATCAEAMGFHPTTASVLDDMRFLISTVLKLPSHPSPSETQKVHTTSAWIYERIRCLPVNSPTGTRCTSSSKLGTPPGDAFSHEPVPVHSSRFDDDHASAVTNAEATDDGHEHNFDNLGDTAACWEGVLPTPPAKDVPDFLYKAVRATALLYSLAVMLRQPFSSIVKEEDFLEVWATLWHVSLTRWKSVLGIFHWIMVSVVATASGTPHGRLVKSMLTTSMLQIGLDNWEVASGAMESAIRLQCWLRGEATHSANVECDDDDSGTEVKSYEPTLSTHGGSSHWGEGKSAGEGEGENNAKGKGKG